LVIFTIMYEVFIEYDIFVSTTRNIQTETLKC